MECGKYQSHGVIRQLIPIFTRFGKNIHKNISALVLTVLAGHTCLRYLRSLRQGVNLPRVEMIIQKPGRDAQYKNFILFQKFASKVLQNLLLPSHILAKGNG